MFIGTYRPTVEQAVSFGTYSWSYWDSN